MVITNRMRPGVSKRNAPNVGGRGLRRKVSRTAIRPSGMLIQNTLCQPMLCVNQPPATGPKLEAATKTVAV